MNGEQSSLPGASSAPALARGEITAILPGDAVLAIGTVGVVDGTTTVGPERVIVAVVGTSLAGGDRLALVPLAGNSEGAHDGGRSQEKLGEGDHDECFGKRIGNCVRLARKKV